MADLIFDHTRRNWNKLQLAIYLHYPDLWEVGETVLEEIATTTATLVSDGTGDNVKAMDDSTLSDLLDDSKPAGYDTGTDTLPTGAPIYWYSKQNWNAIIHAARNLRDAYLSAGTDPFDPING